MRLLDLPEDCNGFLQHLAERPVQGGGVRLVRLAHLLMPPTRIFGIFVNFEVIQLQDPFNTYHYQYFSWKQGPLSGAKGVVLIRSGDRITHLLCLHGFQFATGTEVFNLPGGFMEDDDEMSADLRFATELFEEAGITDSSVTTLDLGVTHPDPGLTNNQPRLFAAIVDTDNAMALDRHHTNLDRLEMSHSVVVLPIEQIWGPRGLVERNSYAFFHVCLTRLQNRGLIPPPPAPTTLA